MKIAIFGCSGFIGENLVKSLRVNCAIQEVSLRDNLWEDSLDCEIEAFINLVGKAHDHQGTATEKDYYFANVELAKQVFEAFKKSDAKLLIHISSLAAVEEFESKFELTEDNACNPQSLYGKSKREAEEWLLVQEIPSDKKVLILRPPMVHGPGDKGNLGLLYKFISKGIPYPLASFDNKRSFISIDNFNYFILEILKKYMNLDSGIYHIADDDSVSTKSVINIIKNITGKKSVNLSIPKVMIQLLAKVGDVLPLPINTKRLKKMTSNLLVSNKKIKSALNIEKLPTSAEEGLIKTIKSFQSK